MSHDQNQIEVLQQVHAARPRPTLLNIPTETRLEILRYLLDSSSSITLQSRDYERTINNDDFPKLYPAILRVCRQLHEEGVVILYEQNTFSFYGNADSCGYLNFWHSLMPAGNIRRIKGLCLYFFQRKNYVTARCICSMLKYFAAQQCSLDLLYIHFGLIFHDPDDFVRPRDNHDRGKSSDSDKLCLLDRVDGRAQILHNLCALGPLQALQISVFTGSLEDVEEIKDLVDAVAARMSRKVTDRPPLGSDVGPDYSLGWNLEAA